jgi:hypothetical protein
MQRRDKLAAAIALTLLTAATPGIAPAQTSQEATSPDGTTATPNTDAQPQRPSLLIDYTVGLGFEHSDNIGLTQDDRKSQNLLTPNLTFLLDKEGSRVQAYASGQVQYVDFLEGEFVNELRGQFTGALNWVMSPDLLSFSMVDTSGVQPVETRVEYAPDNLQQVNVFTAGPTLNLRINPVTRVQAELLYTNTLASKTEYFDSERGSFLASLIRDLSPISRLTFTLESNYVDPRQTDFTNNSFAAPSYTNYRAYGNYRSLLATLSLDVTAGWVDYRFHQGIPSRSGAFGNLALSWQLTPRSSLGFGVGHQFGDAAGEIATDLGALNANPDAPRTLDSALPPDTIPNIFRNSGSGLAVGSSIVTSQVFEENQASISYAFKGEQFGFVISPFYRRQHYVNDPSLDIRYMGASGNVNYRISPLMTLGFSVEHDQIKYLNPVGHDTYTSYGPNLMHQITPHWSWQASLTHGHRNSDSSGHDYTENAVYFAILWTR